MTGYNPLDPQSKRVITTPNEPKDVNRRAVFFGLTILTAIFAICDVLNDIFIRNGSKHPGTNPASWDLLATLLLCTWIYLAGKLWGRKR